MDNKNPHENSLTRLMTQQREGGRLDAEIAKFSANRNVFTERTCALPDYSKYTIAQATPAVEASPNTTPPSADRIWDLKGYWGMHGYPVFTGGTNPTVSVDLWALDPTHNKWFLVEGSPSVSEYEEIHFDGKVRSRVVFAQVSAITGAPTALTITLSAE